MRRLIFTLFLFCSFYGKCFCQVDSLAARPPVDSTSGSGARQPAPDHPRQFRVGFDISRIIFNLALPDRSSYELQADYALRGKLYIAAEAGFGSSKTNYDHLKYTSNNFFARIGVDQSLLDRMGVNDFDMAFLGVRYGLGAGNRSTASYLVPSPFGPPIPGIEPAESYVVHWGEVTAGIRVELWKGVFAGWNARMKFLLNPGSFETISPAYIAGFGKGDKSTAFDFNFYISYALRWKKAR